MVWILMVVLPINIGTVSENLAGMSRPSQCVITGLFIVMRKLFSSLVCIVTLSENSLTISDNTQHVCRAKSKIFTSLQ